MKKLLLTSLFVFLTTSLSAQDTKKMSKKEMMQRIIKMQQESKEVNKKIKETDKKIVALEKLEKKVDKLANTLGVD